MEKDIIYVFDSKYLAGWYSPERGKLNG